jgi:hypothetical protein
MKYENFDTWMVMVNLQVEQLCGLGVNDIPDYNYWDNFDAGVSPEDTAYEALEASGFQF